MSSLVQKYLGDRNFIVKMTSLVIPMLIQMTITNAVNLLDNLMIGRLGTLEMTAVSIVNYLVFVFYICIFGSLSGVGIFSTQYAGAKDHEGMRQCFRLKWLLGLLITGACTLVFWQFSHQLISLFIEEGTSPADAEATLNFGWSYLAVMLWGFLPFTASQIYGSSLKELGETKLPMIAGLVAISVNMIFNWMLIFGACGFPRLGVMGGALATVLSRFVELAIIILVTHRRKLDFPFIQRAYSSLHISNHLIAQVIKRGLPLFMNEFLWASGIAATLQCYSVRGLEVIAANAIVSTTWNLFNTLFISTGIAAGIIVGQMLGAGEVAEAKHATRRLLVWGILSSAATGALMFAIASYIPMLYNTDESVRRLAGGFLRTLALLMPMYGFTHVCYFVLRSGGCTWITFAFDSLYTWLITVPGAWSLAHLTALPILAVYFTVQFGEIGKCLIGYVFIKKELWIHNIVEHLRQ